MKPREFFDLVVSLRQAQRDYFKTRKTDALIESKRLEGLVDAEIDRVQKILDAKAAQDALRQGNTMKAAAAIAKHFNINI
jgi:hypothetical protein